MNLGKWLQKYYPWCKQERWDVVKSSRR